MVTPNWFDIVLALVILSSGLSGLRAGFAKVIVGLVATFIGLLAGFWCYRLVGAKVAPYVSSPAVGDIIGFFLIFIGIMVLGSLIAVILARLFRWIGLSWFDHFVGGIVGLLRGMLFVAGLAAILIAFAPSPAPAFITGSRVLPYATHVAAALAEMAPRDLKDAFLQQWDNLKRMWSTPPEKRSQAA